MTNGLVKHKTLEESASIQYGYFAIVPLSDRTVVDVTYFGLTLQYLLLVIGLSRFAKVKGI